MALALAGIRAGFEGILEIPNSLSQAFPQFGQLLWAEHEQRHYQHNQQMAGLQQIFKHKSSPSFRVRQPVLGREKICQIFRLLKD
jgi:hypothetical protein